MRTKPGRAANWTVPPSPSAPSRPRVLAGRGDERAQLQNKGITATCPSGQAPVGLGADLNTFVGQLLLDDLAPNAGLTAVTVNALEDETGNATNWSVTAYAVCALPVQGLGRVSSTSQLDSVNKRGQRELPGRPAADGRRG